MKKLKISLLTTCLLFVAAGAYAGNYKGEVPCPALLVLNDGFYIGAEAGYDSYRIVYDADFLSTDTAIALDPRINVTGPVGGGFLGFGHYFTSLHNLYLGFELFGNGSGAGENNKWIALVPSVPQVTTFSTDIQVKSNYGLSLLPGIKLNNASLFYIRLGWNWTNIDVNEYVFINSAFVANSIYDVTSNGFNYGLGLETAVVPHVSLRGEYTHTDYSDFTTYALGTRVSPEDNQFMMSLIFHFA